MTAEVVAGKSFKFALSHQQMTRLLTEMWGENLRTKTEALIQHPLTSLDGVKLYLFWFYYDCVCSSAICLEKAGGLL